MIALADLERALWQDRAYARLADSYLHRAVRENALGLTKSRDNLTAAWVAQDARAVMIDHDLGDMIAVTVEGLGRLHRWIEREGELIVRETLIDDFGQPKVARPVHAPLGELRSGRGQFAASEHAVLPPGFPETARPLGDRLHAAWNGRAFDLYSAEWLTALCRRLPDATFTFERALVDGDAIAMLWRVHGHTEDGHRIRLIGSSVFAAGIDDTLIDRAALEAQAMGEVISYAI